MKEKTRFAIERERVCSDPFGAIGDEKTSKVLLLNRVWGFNWGAVYERQRAERLVEALKFNERIIMATRNPEELTLEEKSVLRLSGEALRDYENEEVI